MLSYNEGNEPSCPPPKPPFCQVPALPSCLVFSSLFPVRPVRAFIFRTEFLAHLQFALPSLEPQFALAVLWAEVMPVTPQ